jgi:hypothetical protein
VLLHEHGFGYDSTHAAGTGESGDGRQQVEKQHGKIAHGTILTSCETQEMLSSLSIRHETGSPIFGDDGVGQKLVANVAIVSRVWFTSTDLRVIIFRNPTPRNARELAIRHAQAEKTSLAALCVCVLDIAGSSIITRKIVRSSPSLCAAVCCRLLLLVAPKGQEKGNVSGRFPQTTPIEDWRRTRSPSNVPASLGDASTKPGDLPRPLLDSGPLSALGLHADIQRPHTAD